MAKLIVLAAFNRNEDGDLIPAFQPKEFQSEQSAINKAKLLAHDCAGVVAWSRDADPKLGEYGAPEELFRAGDVPDME